MKPIRLFLIAATLALFAPLSSAQALGRELPTLPLTAGVHLITAEVAADDQAREIGLMYRPSLPPNHGMLFVFDPAFKACMWMRNTLIPLDMLFVDANGRIVNIHERAVPLSDAIIAAASPVRAVIELNGGTAARLGIEPGDRVVFPIFNPKS